MLSENNRPISVDQRRFRTQIPEELHSVFGILKVVLLFFFFWCPGCNYAGNPECNYAAIPNVHNLPLPTALLGALAHMGHPSCQQAVQQAVQLLRCRAL